MDVEIRRQVRQAIDEVGPAAVRRRREGGTASERLARRGDAARVAQAVAARRQQGRRSRRRRTSTSSTSSAPAIRFRCRRSTERIPATCSTPSSSRIPTAAAEEPDALRVAVVGRPNVGKSSFVNRLLGEERLVVAEEAGTTRDAIDTPMRYHGRDVDLRRHGRACDASRKIDDGIEFYSSLRTRRAIERVGHLHSRGRRDRRRLHNQDLKIAALAWESGRGLIVVVNKWDLDEKDDKTAAQVREGGAGEGAVSQVRAVPVHVGAHRAARDQDARPAARGRRRERTSASATSQVNETLAELLARRQPPQAAGREVKLNYATQVETAPPTIAVFGNNPDLVQEHYVRYLHNGFREVVGLPRQSAAHRHAAKVRAEMPPIVGVLIAYLAGSIPAAYLAGKARGIDLRKHGSGNLGATNVVRVLGTEDRRGWCSSLDMPRGSSRSISCRRYIGDAAGPELWALVCGVAAILGHVRPIFLFGKGGGKGVATASGVFLALAFVPDAHR